MKFKVIIFLLLATSASLISCKNENNQKAIAPAEFSFTKEGEASLFKNNGSFIRKIDIEFAEDDYERETGLMHRDALAKHQGMLFVFEEEEIRSFYMKNTKISLDLLFLNRDGLIVSFAENAKPMDETALSSTVPAQYVLEINSGLSEEWVLEIGDRIEWVKD